jgi:hypothetical protein
MTWIWAERSPITALFAWLISHQPTVLFSQNKPATRNQPAVLFSQNKPAPAISHQPNEPVERKPSPYGPCCSDPSHLNRWLQIKRCIVVRPRHPLTCFICLDTTRPERVEHDSNPSPSLRRCCRVERERERSWWPRT